VVVGRRVVVVCCMALLALAGAGRAAAATPTKVTISGADGTPLVGSLYTPATGTPPYPAIVLFHGIGGNRQDLDFVAQRFVGNFVVLAVDARGHGDSGGFVSIDGPNEIADARAWYDYLAADSPEVDPRAIGAWGVSLGGGAVLRSLVQGVPWAAAEVVETWTGLYGALAPQNLSKSGAVYQFLNSVPPDKLDASVAAIENDAIASTNLQSIREFAAQRSSLAGLSQVKTPVYFFQGRRDFAFGIDQALAGYRLVKGPKQLYIGDFGHSPSTFPGPDVNAVLGEGSTFFVRWLLRPPIPPLREPIRVAPDPFHGKTRAYKKLPSTRLAHIRFRGTNTLTGDGKGTRTSGRLPTLLETFGAGRLHFKAKLSGGWQRLVAVLTARTPKHKLIVVSEGGVNTMGLSGKHAFTIRLNSDATVIPRGSRLTVTLATNSLAQDPANLLYLDLPQPPAARITLGAARLDLPVLRKPISR
jgi:pimeloyl-ACP methyl ester carboxylesterase